MSVGLYFTWCVLVAALAVGWLVVCLNRASKACSCPGMRLHRQDGYHFTQFHRAECPNFHA